MTTLSIFDAAADAARAPGLVTATRTYSFSELAALARADLAGLGNTPPAPAAVVGHLQVATVIRLYALMAAGIPFLLLHPRATADQQRRDRARAASLFPSADALALLCTSGSSGVPKVVELSRAAFLASAEASARHLGWQSGDGWLCALPLAHIGGLSILTRCLIARRPLILAEGDHFSPAGVIALAQKTGATLFSAVPTMVAKMTEAVPGWHRDTALRALVLGGARVPPGLLARLGRCPVVVTYGMTETCAHIAATAPIPAAELRPPCRLTPHAGVTVRTDAAGQIFVRGPTLLSQSLPATTLCDGYLATGDVGDIDDRGRLTIFGRADDRIITGGENVDPREVEDALLGIAGVTAACVFGLPDPIWGQVVCAAVAGNLATENPADALAEVAENLASHQRPRKLCVLEPMPIGPTGKIDRRETARVAARRLGMPEPDA